VIWEVGMTDSRSSDRSALLVMDVQQGIVERYRSAAPLLDHLGTVIRAARSAGLPIIYVTVRFREGYPEISSGNRMFAAIRQAGAAMSETSAATDIHPTVAPPPGD